MTDTTKPSAPGSFSKLMTTPPPQPPASLAGQTGRPKPKAGKTRKQAPALRAEPAPSPRSAASQQAVQLTPQSTNQLTRRPVAQSVSLPVDRTVDQQLTGKVVDRPVAFYLPEIINDKIDDAVDYIEKRHRVKVDRSAVVSAILGNPAVWEPDALNQLVDKALGQLTSRLTSRLTR